MDINSKQKRDEAVDDRLTVKTFFPDWFVTSKMLEKFNDALFPNNSILFLMKILLKLYFLANEMGVICNL